MAARSEQGFRTSCVKHDLAAAGVSRAKTVQPRVSIPPEWASAVNRARRLRKAVTQWHRKQPRPEEFLTSDGRSFRGFENKKDKDGNGDDHNPGGNGANTRDRDGAGNMDTEKQSHDDGRGYNKGQNLGFMGEAGFGNAYSYHAGYENGYLVGQSIEA